MTSVQHLGENGNMYLLIQYLGNLETTIVSGERYIVPEPGTPASQRISPDMLVSFNANPALYRRDNSYVVSRQGKPPTSYGDSLGENRQNDVEDKPARYAALGIPEYWRFDETGAFHGTKLAGDGWCRTVRANPIEEIEEVSSKVTAPRWACSSGGAQPAPVARPGDGPGDTHLRAGKARGKRRRGPGQGAGGGAGAEGRRAVGQSRPNLHDALPSIPDRQKRSSVGSERRPAPSANRAPAAAEPQ